jgi:hypothetical protein
VHRARVSEHTKKKTTAALLKQQQIKLRGNGALRAVGKREGVKHKLRYVTANGNERMKYKQWRGDTGKMRRSDTKKSRKKKYRETKVKERARARVG